MGFPRNLEKQDYIQLRLEQDPRPGGRSKANARKYHGGVYHRLAPEVRKPLVDEWRAAQAKGEEVDDDLPAEGQVEVGVEGAKDAGAKEDLVSAKAGVDEGADAAESARAHEASSPEPGEGVSAPAAAVASDQAVEEQTPRSAETHEKPDDAASEIRAQSDAQPLPVADEDDATSTAIEQRDEDGQGDDEGHAALQTELSPASTISDVIPAADKEGEEAGDKEQDTRADSVQPSLPQPLSAATDTTTREQDASLQGVAEDSHGASAQEGEQPISAVASLPAEDSGVNGQPFEEDDDAALTSLEQELEKALGGDDEQVATETPPRRSSIDADTASTQPRPSREQVQNQDKTDSLFVNEGEDENTANGLVNEVSSAETPQDPHHPEMDHEDNVEQIPSQQEGDLAAEFSADEDDDSDADDLLGLQDSDDDDEDEANFLDSNAEQQQDQEGLDFWPSSSNNYGAGDSGCFLPDVMLPEMSPPVQSGSALNAPEVPSMTSSVAQQGDQLGSSSENEKKRKLSDGLSDLSPEVRAAFLDSTEGQGHGQSRYIGIGTPDGERQKRPRLKARRPGQQGSTQPSPQEESPQQPLPPPTSLSAQPTAETPETVVRHETPAAKPSFLSSILNDVKMKPQYPDAPY